MKKRYLWIWTISGFLIGLSLASGSVISCQDKNHAATKQTLQGTPTSAAEPATSEQTGQTLVAPHLDQPMVAGKNMVWSATLQLAWNELLTFAGNPITMENETDLVAMLNRQTIQATDLNLDPASYIAVAGIVGDELRARLQHAAAEQLQRQALADVGSLPQDSLAAYAYLVKTLPFEWAFKRFEQPFAFAGSEVSTFGLKQYMANNPNDLKLANQVVVLDYQSDADYVLELLTTSRQDRLILAKVMPGATLGATVQNVLHRITSARPTQMQNLESLIIPVIEVDRLQNYPELCGRAIQSDHAVVNGKQFSLAAQRTYFRLDETGARLESKTMMFSAKSPRQFIFDQPFLVLLIRQNAKSPYFALWIANAELLTPFK